MTMAALAAQTEGGESGIQVTKEAPPQSPRAIQRERRKLYPVGDPHTRVAMMAETSRLMFENLGHPALFLGSQST